MSFHLGTTTLTQVQGNDCCKSQLRSDPKGGAKATVHGATLGTVPTSKISAGHQGTVPSEAPWTVPGKAGAAGTGLFPLQIQLTHPKPRLTRRLSGGENGRADLCQAGLVRL
jgi:hypothetical protein